VLCQLWVISLTKNHGYICFSCRLDNLGYCFVLVRNPVRHAVVKRVSFSCSLAYIDQFLGLEICVALGNL
jgi:hypothetical protein